MGQPTTDQLGTLFEKYLAERMGWKLCDDRRWQREVGDTRCGVEIKYDRRLHKTGNLYLETDECRCPGADFMVPSGVQKEGYRQFAIGDCSRVLLFTRDVLLETVAAVEGGRLSWGKIVSSDTSRGLIIAYSYMEKFRANWGPLEWDVHPLFCEGKRNMKTNEVVNTTVRDLENEIELWRYRACAWKTKDGVFVSGHDVVMHDYEDGSHLNFFACDLTKSQQQSAYFVKRQRHHGLRHCKGAM